MTMQLNKKMILSLSFLALFSAALPGLAGAQPVSGLKGNINPVTSSMSDIEIEKNVERALYHNMGVDFFNLEINAHNGDVSLSGGVDLPKQIDQASNILSAMGVQSVNNRLAVKQDMTEFRRWLEDQEG